MTDYFVHAVSGVCICMKRCRAADCDRCCKVGREKMLHVFWSFFVTGVCLNFKQRHDCCYSTSGTSLTGLSTCVGVPAADIDMAGLGWHCASMSDFSPISSTHWHYFFTLIMLSFNFVIIIAYVYACQVVCHVMCLNYCWSWTLGINSDYLQHESKEQKHVWCWPTFRENWHGSPHCDGGKKARVFASVWIVQTVSSDWCL